MTFENGAVVTMVNSLVSPKETTVLRVDLEYATLELGSDEPEAAWTLTAAPGHEESVTAAWKRGPTRHPNPHSAQLSAVLDGLESGATPPVPTKDARATLELVTAIYASAFTSQPIGRGEIGAVLPADGRSRRPLVRAVMTAVHELLENSPAHSGTVSGRSAQR